MLSARDLLAWKGLVNENDIVPDLLDTLPWDAVFLSPAEQPEKAVRRKRGRDDGELKGSVKSAVSSYLFKTTKRNPMVIPVVTRL